MLIARYTANASGVVPVFNEGYQYTVNETSSNGVYTVELYSDTDFTSCSFAMKTDLLTIEYLKVTKTVTSLISMFANCYSLTSINCSDWDTSNVINMNSMFLRCESLTELDVSNWDTSNVGTLNRTFYCCLYLKSLDLSNWKTTNVVDISHTFSYCSQMTELNLSGWNVDKVTDTTMTFAYCHKLDTIKIYNCKANMISTLSWSSYFPTEVISGKTRTIYCDEALVGQIEPPTNWVLSSGKESNIKVVEYKFNNTMYNLIPEFNDGFNYTYEDVVEGNVTTRTIHSYSLPTLIRFGINSDGEFGDNKSLSLLEVLSLNANNLNTYQRMFKACENVKSINCENVTINNAYEMFAFCCSLNTLNVSSYDMSNVTNINNMFYYCNNLTSLDISNWSLNDSVDTSNLFNSCFNLNNVIMNNSDYSSVNKIISQLPTRTSDSTGALYIEGVDDISQVDVTTAESKFWNIKSEIKIKVAEYKFDKSIYENLIPEFNEGFTYTYEDSSIMDGFVTRKLYAAENDFVDISKCISRSKETYNSGIYAETDIVEPAPMFLNNEILFRGHEWDLLNIDLSDYQGKEINISFTIEHFANQWSELNVGIELYDDTDFDGYCGVIYEDYLSENLIKEYSVTWTIPNEKCRLYLGGMYLELSNINIMIEDYNLFPNHILTEYDYVNTLGFKVNKPSLYDNKLAFSHYWNGFNIECGQFKGKEATILFDIEEIANSYDYSKCEINIPQTVEVPLNDHYSNTFIIESDYIYIGGNGIKITNLQILVDNRTTEETISNLPTEMRFGAAGESNSKSQSLLEVNYLNTDNLDTMYCMFDECNNVITINTENFNTSNVTDMNAMFYECNNLTSIDISNFDTSNVTDMNAMFYKCAKLTSIDISNFDTSNVTNMYAMFRECHSLTTVGDLSNWDTSNVTDMYSMFAYCNALTSVGDLSNWDVSNVTDMSYMFCHCNSLTSLDISGFDTSKVTDMSNMFNTCSNLTYIEMQNSDYSSVNKIISQLPTRTTDSMGTLDVAGVDDISQVDTATAQSKYWNISTLKQYKIHLITVNNEKVKKIHNQNKKLKISIYKY